MSTPHGGKKQELIREKFQFILPPKFVKFEESPRNNLNLRIVYRNSSFRKQETGKGKMARVGEITKRVQSRYSAAVEPRLYANLTVQYVRWAARNSF